MPDQPPKDPMDPIRKYSLELAISICRDGRGILDPDATILKRAEAFDGYLRKGAAPIDNPLPAGQPVQ